MLYFTLDIFLSHLVILFYRTASNYLSVFETLGRLEDRDSLVSAVRARNVKVCKVTNSYIQPKMRTRSSDVHRISKVGSHSSVQTGFNQVNLCDYDMKLLRWIVTDEELDAKILNIFGQVETMEEFVLAQSEILILLRAIFCDYYRLNKKGVDELTEFQPIFILFLQGFLKDLSNSTGRNMTAVAANGFDISANFMVNGESGMMVEKKGAADVFVLQGVDDTIDLIEGNVAVAFELKHPHGKLYHTSNREGMDQLVCEVEGLHQTSISLCSSSTASITPQMTKGCLTDLFAICLDVRADDCHCITNRVVDPILYIKYLIYIVCDLGDDDMKKCLKEENTLMVPDDGDVSEAIGKRKSSTSSSTKCKDQKKCKGPKKSKSKNGPGAANRRSHSSSENCWNHSDVVSRLNAKLETALSIDYKRRARKPLGEVDLNRFASHL